MAFATSTRVSQSQNPIKLTVHPAEMFPDNLGGLESIACSSQYIIAVGKTDKMVPVMKVYNAANQLISEPNQVPLGVYTGRVLANWVSSWFVPSSFPDETSKNGISKIHPSEVASLREAVRNNAVLIQKSSGNYYDGNLFQSELIDCVFLGKGSKVFSEPSGQYVIFRSENIVRVVDTLAGGQALKGINEWNVGLYERSNISKEALTRLPFLSAHATTPLGVPMEGINRSIAFDGKTLSLVDSSTGVRLYTEAASGYSVDPKDKSKIYYTDTWNRTLNILDAAGAKAGATSVESINISFEGEITDLKFDPAGNYLLCTVVLDQKESLKVLSRDTLEILAELDGVRGPLTMDSAGSMYFIDPQGKLRLVTTNLASLDQEAFERKKNELAERRAAELERLNSLDLPDIQVALPNSGSLSEDENFLLQAKQRITKKLAPEIEQATTADTLSALITRIGLLKAAPDMVQFSEAFEDIEQALQEKQNGFLLERLKTDSKQFMDSLPDSLTSSTLKDIEDAFRELKLLRLQVQIVSLEDRKQIDGIITQAQEKKEALVKAFATNAQSALEDTYEKLKESIDFCSSIPELQTLLISDNAKDFDATVAILPEAEERRAWKDKLKVAISERKTTLQEQEKENYRLEQERLEETIDAAQEILAELADDLASADPSALSSVRNTHPLALRFRQQISALPKEIRDAAQNQLTQVIDSNRKRSRGPVSTNIVSTGAEIKFGAQSFPVFAEYSKFSNPKLIPTAGKASTFTLVFQDTIGRIFNSGEEFTSKNPNTDEVKAAILRIRPEANSYFENLPRAIPQYQDTWVMAPSVEKYLETMCRRFNSQLKRGRGILVLEGEAGTGKNVIVDMFCYFTKRETMTFACNFQTEKEDLTYAFRFDKERGTYQVDAKLIEMIQTPGAVIVFDEINTLPPGVLKMLNSLFDYRRTLFLPDGRVIKAESSVIFVAAMNPRHYLGVKELSKEMVSRGQFMNVDYPPIKKQDGTYAPDEALMVSREVNELADLTTEQFTQLWEEAINKNADQVSGFTYDQTLQVEALHKIVKMADAVRNAYVSYRTGQSNEIIDLVYSLRETSDIASELTPGCNVLEIALDIVLPKISDINQRQAVELLMRNAI